MENNNDLKNSLESMMSGLNGMVKALDSTLSGIKQNMTPDQAIEFSKSMQNANISDKLKDFNKINSELKKEFGI